MTSDYRYDERRFVMDQNHQLEELLETQQAVLEKLTSIHKWVVFFGIVAIASLVLAFLGSLT